MTLMISKFKHLLPFAMAVLKATCAPLSFFATEKYPGVRARVAPPPDAWPDFAPWLGSRQVAVNLPYSYINYRYVTEVGALVNVDAVVDQRLLRPKTQNNTEFLVAGRPALRWGHGPGCASERRHAGRLPGHHAVPVPCATFQPLRRASLPRPGGLA